MGSWNGIDPCTAIFKLAGCAGCPYATKISTEFYSKSGGKLRALNEILENFHEIEPIGNQRALVSGYGFCTDVSEISIYTIRDSLFIICTGCYHEIRDISAALLKICGRHMNFVTRDR